MIKQGQNHVDISVCIVTYNHEKYISDCIMNAVSQSGDFSMEVLIGVDDSQDRTLKIVADIAKKYPKIVKYYHHKPRLGYGSKNMQTLLKLAKGRYIAYLDGDDYWLPGKLNAQIKLLDRWPSAIACYTNALVENKNKNLIGLFNNYTHPQVKFEKLLTSGNFLTFSSLVFRSEFVPEIIGLKASFIDYKVNLMLARSGKVLFLQKPMTVYRNESENSIRLTANDYVRERYWHALTSEIHDGISRKVLLICLAEFLRSVFYKSIRTRNYSLLTRWYNTILGTYSFKAIGLIVYTALAIIRFPLREIKGRFTNKRTKILYRI